MGSCVLLAVMKGAGGNEGGSEGGNSWKIGAGEGRGGLVTGGSGAGVG